MPRSRVEDAIIVINHNQRYPRTAKRAVQLGEKKDKEQKRRRRGASPQPRSQRPGPAHFLDTAYTPQNRKRTTGRREKTNE